MHLEGLARPSASRCRLAVSLAILLGAAACGSPGDGGGPAVVLAPESALPGFLKEAPPQVREAYRFAIANRELLAAFPCYCGCGSVAHTSNLQCYVKAVRPDGSLEFDHHALG